MKALLLLVITCLGSVWAQSAPTLPAAPTMPDLPDDTVVATFEDGGKMTMGEFKKLYAVLPPENQQMALRDRTTFLKQWALMRKLSKMAETQGLDKSSPNKEALDYYRMMILSQAKISDVVTNTTVEPAEVVKYYDQNKDKYKQVRLKAIYVAFSTSPDPSAGKKQLTEAQAKTKAEKLTADLRAGGDFAKLAKTNSDDETSRDKDGDFATLRPNDNVPDAIRSAVFQLKQGEISEPVQQPNGFYVFRAEEVTYRPLSQVRDEIFSVVKQEHYTQWLDKTNKELNLQFNSPEFLGLIPLGTFKK